MRWRTVPASPRGPGGGNTTRRGLQLACEGTQSEAADPLRATGMWAGSVPLPGSGLPGNIRAGRVGCEGIGPVREGDASEYAACADEDGAGGSDPLDSLCPAHVDSFVRSKRKSRWSHPGGTPSSSSVMVPTSPRFVHHCGSIPGSDVGDRRGFLLGSRAVRTRVRSLGWFRFTLEHSPFHWVAFSFSTWVRPPFEVPGNPPSSSATTWLTWWISWLGSGLLPMDDGNVVDTTGKIKHARGSRPIFQRSDRRCQA